MEQKLKQDFRIGPNIRKYRMQSHLTQDQVCKDAADGD